MNSKLKALPIAVVTAVVVMAIVDWYVLKGDVVYEQRDVSLPGEIMLPVDQVGDKHLIMVDTYTTKRCLQMQIDRFPGGDHGGKTWRAYRAQR